MVFDRQLTAIYCMLREIKPLRRLGMKKLGLITGVIVGVAGLLFSLSVNANAGAKDEKAIKDIESKMIATTNTDDLMKYYDPNDVVVYDFAGPLEYKGNAAVRADFDAAFAGFIDAKGEFVELEVVTDGKLGIARSIQHFTFKDKDGKPQEATFRVTDVFHKVDGKWKAIQTHVSAPMDPKTGMTQMNLKS
jgi:ketosteroid isomerase-like protein